MSRLAFAIMLIIFCGALCSCGQKGPLVRPGPAPAAAHTAPPPPSSDLPTPNPDEHR